MASVFYYNVNPTNDHKGVAVRIPFIGGPASAVSYFAANAKSPSLRKKMQRLTVSNETLSSDGPPSTQLAEARLRELVHTDSNPINSKSSQSSGSGDAATSLPEHDNDQLSAFSEVGIREEMLPPGDWPPTQVSMLGTGGVGSELNQDLMPWPGMHTHTTGWSYHLSNDDSHLTYIHDKDTAARSDVLGMAQTQRYDGVPGYFCDYMVDF